MAARSVDTFDCAALSAASAFLMAALISSASIMLIRIFSSHLPDLGGRRFDLVLHRAELVVGLDLHQLVFVFALALLDRGEVLVDVAAPGLAFGEGVLGGVEGGGGVVQERVERGDSARSVRDGFGRHRGLAFDLLKFDQPCKIGKHSSFALHVANSRTVNCQLVNCQLSKSGPTWIRTRDQPVMSRPL